MAVGRRQDHGAIFRNRSSWLGIWTKDHQVFDAAGLPRSAMPLTSDAVEELPAAPITNALLSRGSLVIELVVPDVTQPEPVLLFERAGDWPMRLGLAVHPDGVLVLELDHFGSGVQKRLRPVRLGRDEPLRLTLFWDAPTFRGWVSMEQPGGLKAEVFPLENPRPWRLVDLRALLSGAVTGGMAACIHMMALSAREEPVGVMPGLATETQIETDRGPRAMAELRRGDLLRNATGDLVPVLHVVQREVPAAGSWRPVQLRAPYFGLRDDCFVAPHQRVVLSGSEVEYLFGTESVLATAGTLEAPRKATRSPVSGGLVTYGQVILPAPEIVSASGLGLESLFLGRVRRNRPALAHSLLSQIDHNSLPEHAQPCHPVVRAFDAAVLAETRSA